MTTYQLTQAPGTQTYSPGPGVSVTVYCADSRVLQIAGLLSASSLVASSLLVWKYLEMKSFNDKAVVKRKESDAIWKRSIFKNDRCLNQ